MFKLKLSEGIKNNMIRKCVICGKDYESHGRVNVCSDACRKIRIFQMNYKKINVESYIKTCECGCNQLFLTINKNRTIIRGHKKNYTIDEKRKLVLKSCEGCGTKVEKLFEYKQSNRVSLNLCDDCFKKIFDMSLKTE